MSGVPALVYVPPEDIDSLHAVFPTVPREDIEKELRKCNGSREIAMEALRMKTTQHSDVNCTDRAVHGTSIGQTGPVYAALPASSATAPSNPNASVQIAGVLPPPTAPQQVAVVASAPPMPSAPPVDAPAAAAPEAGLLPVATAVQAAPAPVSVVNVSSVPEPYSAQPGTVYQQSSNIPAVSIMHVAPPPPAAPATGPSRQQCTSCHQSSMIQAPANMPVGSIAMKWRCPSCGGQNQMSLTPGAQTSLPPAPAPLPQQTSPPMRQQCQCSNCRLNSTIQFPPNAAVGTVVSWRCPSCHNTNQAALQPHSPPKISSGLPAQSTHTCRECRKASRIGLPTMVSAGTKAVSWKCPTCRTDNEVQIPSAGGAMTGAGLPQMYEQYGHAPVRQQINAHPQYHGQQQEQATSLRSCVCCHGSFSIKAPAGATKVSWKCPKCHMMNN